MAAMEELDEEKIAELKELFALYDPDSTGTVKSSDLGDMLAKMGLELFPEEVEDFTVEMDKNCESIFWILYHFPVFKSYQLRYEVF